MDSFVIDKLEDELTSSSGGVHTGFIRMRSISE